MRNLGKVFKKMNGNLKPISKMVQFVQKVSTVLSTFKKENHFFHWFDCWAEAEKLTVWGKHGKHSTTKKLTIIISVINNRMLSFDISQYVQP